MFWLWGALFWKVENAYSVDPLVLYLTNEEENTWNISTFKADGSTRSQK